MTTTPTPGAGEFPPLPAFPEFSHFLENSTHHMQRDAIRAYAREYARLAIAAAPKVEREGLLSTSDLADLERLNEVFEDGQGWDIPKERMKRLAELGAVRWHGRTRYSITAFGMLCLGEGETPLRTVEEANAAAHARMLARNGIPAPAHGERREAC